MQTLHVVMCLAQKVYATVKEELDKRECIRVCVCVCDVMCVVAAGNNFGGDESLRFATITDASMVSQIKERVKCVCFVAAAFSEGNA